MFLSNVVKVGIGSNENMLNNSNILDMNFISIKKYEMEITKGPLGVLIKHIGFPGSVNKAHRVPRERQ